MIFMEVIKVKWGHEGGPWSSRIGVLIRRDSREPSFFIFGFLQFDYDVIYCASLLIYLTQGLYDSMNNKADVTE